MSRHHSGTAASTAQLANQTQSDAVRPERTQRLPTPGPSEQLRANETQALGARPNGTQDAQDLAAVFFDEALTRARITSSEAAFLLGVSESLVRRMRSKDARERVSFVQLLKLPIGFHIELHRAMNRHYGFGRAALRRVLDDIGSLALLAEAR